MGPQKYKIETQKNVDFRRDYFCIFFSVWIPLWARRINEYILYIYIYINYMEVRGILVIQVSSPRV